MPPRLHSPSHAGTGSRIEHVLRNLGLVLCGIILVVFALIGFFFTFRGTPIRTVRQMSRDNSAPPVSSATFRETMELFTGTPLLAGNQVAIMINGDQTYPRLWADLRGAKKSITIQLYYCNPGRMAEEFKRIVTERARAGVRVLFLYDTFGAGPLPASYFSELRRAGVLVAGFRPVKWYALHKIQQRSHIRVVVVDGRIGYTGGFGLDDKWFGDGRHKGQWRDSNVRFTGPAVLQLQATFAAGWAEATGELLTGSQYFPFEPFVQQARGVAGLMHTAPTLGSTAAERYFALSIAGAEHTLYISNSYFVPDDDFRSLLKKAAARGVDVRILTAGPATDVKTTWYAGRARYEELLAARVRIFEYQPVMMHAKSLVADGLWSSVGTMNFDNRSLAFNDESNLNMLDRENGATMDSIFLEDLRYSREITLPEFRKRPWREKIWERIVNLASRAL